MAFARLAPHCGLTPVYGHYIGNCEMRGGFSWSSLGSTLSSGIKSLGNFAANTARRIGQSEGFRQAKQGFLNSGVIENAGALAGQTINSLVDIGRLKMEQDISRLRDRALGVNEPGIAPPLTQEQLMQLLAAANTSQVPVVPSAPAEPVLTTPVVAPTEPVIQQTQLPPPPIPVPRPSYLPPAPTDAVALGPLVETTETVSTPSFYRPPSRKRRRVSGWGAALQRMTGGSLDYDAARYCF